MESRDIRTRVRETAQRTLAEQNYVSAVDVLFGLGWLAPSHLDQWRQGRVPCLERVVQANLSKVSTAMTEFRRWARENDLIPSETAYVARTRDRRALRFSVSNDEGIDRAYRTHWVSPTLSSAKRQRLAERQGRPGDLVVIAASKPWTCGTCATGFMAGEFLMMADDSPRCLDCVELDHLEYLPAGDAGLTRRARQASGVCAVVVRWSRSRKRYERQGILLEPAAIEQATRDVFGTGVPRVPRG